MYGPSAQKTQKNKAGGSARLFRDLSGGELAVPQVPMASVRLIPRGEAAAQQGARHTRAGLHSGWHVLDASRPW